MDTKQANTKLFEVVPVADRPSPAHTTKAAGYSVGRCLNLNTNARDGALHEHGVIVENSGTTQGAPILFLVPRSTRAISAHDVVAGRELPRALRGIACSAAVSSDLGRLVCL